MANVIICWFRRSENYLGEKSEVVQAFSALVIMIFTSVSICLSVMAIHAQEAESNIVNRAYLSITSVEAPSQNQIVINIRNVGKTPANVSRVVFKTEIDTLKKEYGNRTRSAIVGPGLEYSYVSFLNNDQSTEISKGKHVSFFYEVYYKDYTGKSRIFKSKVVQNKSREIFELVSQEDIEN